GPAQPVVIREPDSRRIEPLLDVQGKGKDKRRTHMLTKAFGHAESPSFDAELALTNSEMESDNIASKIDTRDQDEVQARPNRGDHDEESQPQSSHVVHAGPNLEHMDLEATDTSNQQNPEQMDEEFTTTAYPKNLNIPHWVSKAVDEIVTDAVDLAMKAPLRDRFSDLPAEEARHKKIKRCDVPRTPSGSPSPQSPPPPPPTGAFGTPGSEAPSSFKFAALVPQSLAWTTSDTRYKSAGVSGTQDLSPTDSLIQDDSIPEEQTGDMTNFLNWYCRQVNKTVLTPAYFKGQAYEVVKGLYPDVIHLLVDVNRPLPLDGPPGHVTIQTQFFFNKDMEYLRYGSKDMLLRRLEKKSDQTCGFSVSSELNPTQGRYSILHGEATKRRTRETNAEAEVQSMVSVPIHQDTSSVPPMRTLSITDPTLVKCIDEREQHMANLLKYNLTVEEVNEIVTDVVELAMQAPLRARFSDLPAVDMKEILKQRIFEDKSYEAHEDHKKLYDPPPPPPPTGAFGTPGTSRASGSSQSPTPPPPPSIDYLIQDDSIPDEQVHFYNDENFGNDHLSKADSKKDWWKLLPEKERPATPKPAWTIPFSNVSDIDNNWATAEQDRAYTSRSERVDWTNPEGDQIRVDVNRPLPLDGPPGHVTIQTQFFFNKDLKYLRYGSKGSSYALSISKIKAASYLYFGLELLVPEQMSIDDKSDQTCEFSVLSELNPTQDMGRYSILYGEATRRRTRETNAEAEVQSLVSVPIHQDTSLVPSMTTLVIDLMMSQSGSPLPTSTEEARQKKIKRRDVPRTPFGSPSPQPPPPPPPTGAFGTPGTSGSSGSSQLPTPPPRPSTELSPTDYLIQDDSIPNEQVHLSNDEDFGNDHLPKADSKKDWWKLLPEEEIPTGDMKNFLNWYCRQVNKTVLTPADLKGQAYEVVKAFYPDVIHLQFQIEECPKMHTDQVNWTNPEGDQVRVDVNRPMPLNGPLGHVTIQKQFFFNTNLEYLRYGNKGSSHALSISKIKAASYPNFSLELPVPEQMWIDDAGTPSFMEKQKEEEPGKPMLKQRLDKHGSRLYKLENLNIPHRVRKAVNEIVTDAVELAMQAPLRACFSDLPAEEARQKKIKRRDVPRTPSGSPSPQPPPPPPPTGAFGTPGTSGASGSSQLPTPPPPPSTGTSGSAQTQELSLTVYLIQDDSIPDEQVHLSNDENSRNDHLPKAGSKKTGGNYYLKRKDQRLLNLLRPFHFPMHQMLRTIGLLRHVTIQTQFFFNTNLEYLRYGSKGSIHALSISKIKAASYLNFDMLLRRFEKKSDQTCGFPVSSELNPTQDMEKYEYAGPKVTTSHGGNTSTRMIKRFTVADDLKEISKITQVEGTMLKDHYINVMDAPTITVSVDSSKGNFRDAIDIGVDVVHPVPVVAVAFPAVTIVTTLACHGKAIPSIHEHLQRVPIEEDMSTLRFRMGMAEAENDSLRGKIRTIEAIEIVTYSQERRAHIEMERQLASV
nr:hypothetical protein [Tanacetum cinerariifolium]